MSSDEVTEDEWDKYAWAYGDASQAIKDLMRMEMDEADKTAAQKLWEEFVRITNPKIERRERYNQTGKLEEMYRNALKLAGTTIKDDSSAMKKHKTENDAHHHHEAKHPPNEAKGEKGVV